MTPLMQKQPNSHDAMSASLRAPCWLAVRMIATGAEAENRKATMALAR